MVPLRKQSRRLVSPEFLESAVLMPILISSRGPNSQTLPGAERWPAENSGDILASSHLLLL